MRRHGIGYHEKHRGQLFCDDSSERIIGLLTHEAEAGGVAWRSPCAIGPVAEVMQAELLTQLYGHPLRELADGERRYLVPG